jgi:ATP-dependent helicase/nuclease subunit A
MKAEKRHFEIPFAIRTDRSELGAAGPGGSGLPVILRGTIDLIFREEDRGGRNDRRHGGWVIADYKTDRVPLANAALESMAMSLDLDQARAVSPEFAAVIDRYSPQVRLYGRFWRQITGERVIESGLYFTSIDRWVSVPLPV